MAARRRILTLLAAVVGPTIAGGALSQLGASTPAGQAVPAFPEPSTSVLLSTSTSTTTTTLVKVVHRPARTATTSTVPADLARVAIWYALADCETGVWTAGKIPVSGTARWDISARGYQGGLQFHPTTWDRNNRPGDPEDAHQATPAQQIAVGEIVLARQGVKAWPTCGPRTGLERLVGAAPTHPDDGFPAGDPTQVYEGSIGGLTTPP